MNDWVFTECTVIANSIYVKLPFPVIWEDNYLSLSVEFQNLLNKGSLTQSFEIQTLSSADQSTFQIYDKNPVYTLFPFHQYPHNSPKLQLKLISLSSVSGPNIGVNVAGGVNKFRAAIEFNKGMNSKKARIRIVL